VHRRALPHRVALAVAAPVAVAVAVAASPSPSSPPPTVTLWHSYRGAERDALESVLSDLDASRDDLRIEVLAVPSKVYKYRLQNGIPRGNGPDLFIEAHELCGEWSRAGLLAPARFPADLPASGFAPASVEALRFDGQLWGVPIAVKSPALFWNRARVDAAPATMSDLLAAGRAAPGALRALAWETGEFYHHAPFLHAFGGRVLDSDGQPHLDEPAVARSFAYVAGLVASGAAPPESDGAMVATLFNQGQVPFVFNGPWFVGEIKPGVDFSVSPLPLLDDAGGAALRPFLTVESLFRAANGRAPEAAVDAVVGAVAGLPGSVRRALEGRQALPLLSARAEPRVAADPILTAFSAQADSAIPMPNRPEMGVAWEPANRALRAVLRGSLAPEAAARRAQREVRLLLVPPPEPANPRPWLAALGLGLLLAAAAALRSARRAALLPALRRAGPAYLWLLPMALGMGAVVVLPFLVGAGVSLFSHHEGRFTFVGLHNFVRIISSRDYAPTEPLSFWYTLAVTVLWTVCNVTLHTGFGLALALLLRDPWMKLKGVYRVLLIVPWAVPNYITALIWKGMFNEQFGAINALLSCLGLQPVAWFSRFFTAFAANLSTNTWLGFPFMMVVTLGALQSIPRDLEEAAEVDGAGAWLRFRHVTLPLLRPALLPAVILGSVWTFNMFNIIYLVSGGDPDGSTEILISEAYKWAFTRQSQYGYAAAYALLVFGILLLWSRLTRRMTAGASA
jgi:arabinogalactan oligomer/maltooligosaccharide transport system permease protein